MTRRALVRLAQMTGGLLVCAILLLVLLAVRPPAREPNAQTCFDQARPDLHVCHAVSAEGVFFKPSATQIAYNTQVIALGDSRYETVLHSEAEDNTRYRQATGRLRPGDSIKTGLSNTADPSRTGLAAPRDLAFRIWGTLSNRASPLFYDYVDPRSPEAGLSGGANPMMVSGRRADGDPYYYMFFLGVVSDAGQGTAWRNVLLEARTTDFVSFDVLSGESASTAAWVAFAPDGIPPAIVTDVAGHRLVSNHPAPVAPADSTNPQRPPGSVNTAGLFGSVVHIAGHYDYFYTDQDVANPAVTHLYLRTADDISGAGRWSEPSVVMDVPPEVIVRVAKARGADRWAVLYSCLRSLRPFLSDICVRYTATLAIDGEGGLSALRLFNAPFDGISGSALGLLGGSANLRTGGFLKAQQFYMTDADGNLAAPPDAGPAVGGVLTWLDLPLDLGIFGASTYWAEWTVVPH